MAVNLQAVTFGFLLDRLLAQVPQLAVSKLLLEKPPTLPVMVVTLTFAVARRLVLTA
jgi:hypothetical protein